MRIPGPAGEFQARLATWHREEREREEEQEQGERRRDDVRDGENIQNEKKRKREEEGERDHPRVSNATTTKRSLWQKLFDYSSSPSPNDDAKNHGDDSSLALFKQKQFQNIQWLKNGGWRSGRLSKARFIVEKMKKVKRKSATGTNVALGGDQNDQLRTLSSLSASASPFSVFDGSLLVSDENGDTITATCDGETLKMLLTHKNTTKKRGTRVGMIVRDVAVLNASATEQHLVFRSKSLVEVFFQEEVEGGGTVEVEKGRRGKENVGAVAIEVDRVEKGAPQPQPQQKAVSAFALQAMKLMEKRKAKAAAAAKAEAEK